MITIEDLKQKLDAEQFAAVTAPEKKILIMASAGSGKTTTICHRIAYQISQGQPENSFLMMTFTNKAAKEMTDRIKSLLGKKELDLVSGTFHSVGYKFVKNYYLRIGAKRPIIIDEDEQRSLMTQARDSYLKSINYTGKKGDLPPVKDMVDAYSYSRNTEIPLADVIMSRGIDKYKILIEKCVSSYEKIKNSRNLMDFDDIMNTFLALLNNDDFRKEIQEQYTEIFVDEYQDINIVQHKIIERLTQDIGHLTVVGDDGQSIYAFRGGCIDFIADAAKDPSYTVYDLKNNYRSSAAIVGFALNVVNNGAGVRHKDMQAVNAEGSMPAFVPTSDERKQGFFIAKNINSLLNKDVPPKEIAILIRSNACSRSIETALKNYGIQYNLEAGVNFFARAHIKLILANLRFIVDTEDTLALRKMLLICKGLGEKTADQLIEDFKTKCCNDITRLQFLKVPGGAQADFQELCESLTTSVELYKDSANNPNIQAPISDFINKFRNEFFDERFCEIFKNDDADTLNERLTDLESMDEDTSERYDLQDYLDEAALVSEKINRKNAVVITTMHRAKGREWDYVFLPYMNDTLIPASEDEEEEKRLMYVAVTRARKMLVLTSTAKSVLRNGLYLTPTKFLKGNWPYIQSYSNY